MDSSVVANLKKYGFSKGINNVLSPNEMQELKTLINELFETETDIEQNSADCPVIINLQGRINRVDELIEKILSNQSVKSVLSGMLGDTYKVWQINARRSHSGDKGLYLHQDAPCQCNLALLLSDNLKGDGATAFIPGSHKLPRWSQHISWSNIKLAAPWLKSLNGAFGEVAFFLNRTWHARLKNSSKKIHDIILIGFYPQGGIYQPYRMSKEQISRWKGWELYKLLDTHSGTKLLDDGRVQVVSPIDSKIHESYALSLESNGENVINVSLILLYLKIIFFEIIYLPWRIFRIVRSIYRDNKSIK